MVLSFKNSNYTLQRYLQDLSIGTSRVPSVLKLLANFERYLQLNSPIISMSMKTKFLRFNKLPKLDTLNNQSPDKLAESGVYNQRDHPPSTHFKAQSLKTGDFFDLFENILKRMPQPQNYVLQPRDRAVIIPLPDIQEEDDINIQGLKTWVTEVCNKVVSSAFCALSTDQLNYQQTKIFCSEGILRNIVLLVERYRLNKEHIRIINSHIQDNIVPYLKRKYPMTESSDVNKALDDSVKPIDNTQALQNDLYQKSDVVFTYRDSGNYNDLIMKLLNWMMVSVDSKASDSKKTVYEQYYNTMSNLFENVYHENWMNAKALDSANMSQEEKNSQLNKLNNPKNEVLNQKYAAQVKEYTHYVIGRKISKNIPIYTEEQINGGHLMIKSPAILRILTKWADQLWEKFKKKNYFLDRQENVRVQEKDGNINTMFMWMKLPLNDLIQDQKAKIQAFMKEIQQNNFDQQTQLLKQELFEKDGFYHIERIEKVCGKFAYKTVNNLHSYIVLYLNRIIHGLLTVSKELYEAKLSTKARWSSPPDLLSFKIGDLMRCKCSSKERQILRIFQQLESISQKDPKLLKIIRVKNRLKLGTNDILINVLYKNKYLCEIQLAVKSSQSKFISCSNMFNHYIYELGRTLFGPITQLSSVWMSLDPKAPEYQNIIKNQKKTILTEEVLCTSPSKKHYFETLDRPFICQSCNIAYSHTNYFWNHEKCMEDRCNFMICAKCKIENQDKQNLKRKLLQDDQQLLRACTNIVNRKKQSQQVIPQYGICIPIQSKKIKIQKFKKLEVKKIMTIYGLKKDKNGVQKITLISQLIKKDAQKNFLKNYLVFQIPDDVGQKLIDINLDRAKKQYIIPQKVKQIYKKEKQILSLIEENIDDNSVSIMKGSPSGMENIKNLQLADNKLTNIKFIVQNFPELQRLQLSRNQITNIDGVGALKHLTKLNVRNNAIKSLPDELCTLQKLEGLNVRHNKIPALPQNFGNLKLLNKLQSDNNKITSLPQSFKNLTKLKFIDFSKNLLTAFPDVIKGFPKLKQLLLSNNPIEVVPAWIGDFKDMITLDLSRTKIQNLPDQLFNLKNLQVLKITANNNDLSTKIGNLTSLRQLFIQMPNVHALPNQIFNLVCLETLQIEDSRIEQLPDCLSEMKKLTKLSLVNNKLDRLCKEFIEMTQVRQLKIEGQNISSLPEGMENLVNIRILSLNKNKFKVIPPQIKSYSRLFSLTMQNNLLQSIDDDFISYLPELQTLTLDNNKLTSLPSSLQLAKKLKKFTYQNNPIEQKPLWMDILFAAIQNAKKQDQTFRKTTTNPPGLSFLSSMSREFSKG